MTPIFRWMPAAKLGPNREVKHWAVPLRKLSRKLLGKLTWVDSHACTFLAYRPLIARTVVLARCESGSVMTFQVELSHMIESMHASV